MAVGGNDGDLVGIIDGQVGVYEDKKVCDCFGQGEGISE